MSLGYGSVAEFSIGGDGADIGVGSPTGLSSSATLGSPTIIPQCLVSVSGVEATSALGTVEANSQFIALVTGLSSSATLGSVTVELLTEAPVSGVEVTTTLGDVLIPVTPAGVSSLAELGSVIITGSSVFSLTGLEGTSTLGDETAFTDFTAVATGFGIATELGLVSVEAGAVALLTGVSASGETSTPVLWGRIVPDPGTTWSEVAA